jgi:hypothetical protein
MLNLLPLQPTVRVINSLVQPYRRLLLLVAVAAETTMAVAVVAVASSKKMLLQLRTDRIVLSSVAVVRVVLEARVRQGQMVATLHSLLISP